MEASPVLLEPIASLKVTVPDKYHRRCHGRPEQEKRPRARHEPGSEAAIQIVEADIPMTGAVRLFDTDLRSMTGGSGTYQYEFARYEQAPSDVQEKEIEARQKVAEE